MKADRYKKRAIFSEIGKHCTFSKPHDFIEVSKWYNEEGYTININSITGSQTIEITEGEFRLIKKLIKKLDK